MDSRCFSFLFFILSVLSLIPCTPSPSFFRQIFFPFTFTVVLIFVIINEYTLLQFSCPVLLESILDYFHVADKRTRDIVRKLHVAKMLT